MAKNEVDSAIQRLLKLGVKVTKLWENASPNSAFAAQRLDVPWEEQDFLYVEHKYDNSNDSYRTCTLTLCKLGYRAHFESLYLTSTGPMRGTDRIINLDKTGSLYVNNGWYQVSNTSGSPNTSYVIPTIILGIKLLGGGQA